MSYEIYLLPLTFIYILKAFSYMSFLMERCLVRQLCPIHNIHEFDLQGRKPSPPNFGPTHRFAYNFIRWHFCQSKVIPFGSQNLMVWGIKLSVKCLLYVWIFGVRVKKWQNYVSVIVLIKLCFDISFVYYSCLMFIVLHKNLQAAFDLLVAQR